MFTIVFKADRDVSGSIPGSGKVVLEYYVREFSVPAQFYIKLYFPILHLNVALAKI